MISKNLLMMLLCPLTSIEFRLQHYEIPQLFVCYLQVLVWCQTKSEEVSIVTISVSDIQCDQKLCLPKCLLEPRLSEAWHSFALLNIAWSSATHICQCIAVNFVSLLVSNYSASPMPTLKWLDKSISTVHFKVWCKNK